MPIIPTVPTKPSGFEAEEEVKPPEPVVNVATGETEEASKKQVTLESYAPIDTIDIGGSSFKLPIEKEIIEDDSEPAPPLPERKVAPVEDVANLMTSFRESYMAKRKAVTPTVASPSSSAAAAGSFSSGLEFSDANEAVAPTVVEPEVERPPPPEISIPPGGISRDG